MTTSTEDEAPPRSLRRAVADRLRPVKAPARPLRQRLRLPLMLAGPIVVIAAASWWYLTSGRYVSTDDAYIQAARTMISTDVSGRVVAIDVDDNQRVTKGQELFRLDDRPYRIAVEEARASLNAARIQVDALKATYRQKVADNKGAQDTLAYQQREFDRQRQLASTGVASRATYDQVQNALAVAQQKVDSSQSDIANILAQLDGNPEIPVDQHPSVQRAQAALDRAELNLSYTIVHAPQDGIVTKVEQLQVGSYVNASAPVFSMVSDRFWIEANFKETELTFMRSGQDATILVDTYPDVVLHARVESLSPGTGLTFSLLPPENATGNWVKVVQRLPVRLTLENPDPKAPLQAGLSVTAEVDTHYRRPWLVWLDNSLARVFGTAHAAEQSH